MRRVAQWVGMTEGQVYTVAIGLVIGAVTILLGIPPVLDESLVSRAQIARPQSPGSAASRPSTTASVSDTPSSPIGDGLAASGPLALTGDDTIEIPSSIADGAPVDALGTPGAGAPIRVGWWAASPVGAGVPGLGSSPAPPDVPADGLYVAGGITGPQAYAAMVYELREEVSAAALTLQLAPGSAATPDAGVMVCPLRPTDIEFASAQGADAAGGPRYDCERAVAGTRNDAGDAYVFDLTPLLTGGDLGVAIVPRGPVDRVVFSRPGDGSLATP